MLNVPLNFVLPMLSGGLAGTLEWPALGAVLIWLLILCVLGVSVGMLREYRRLLLAPPDDHASEPAEMHFDLSHKHLKAA